MGCTSSKQSNKVDIRKTLMTTTSNHQALSLNDIGNNKNQAANGAIKFMSHNNIANNGITDLSSKGAMNTLKSVKSPIKGNSNDNNKTLRNEVVLRALFDFRARTDEDLSIQKNDVLVLIDGADENWWYCKNKRTGLQGYVPSNHVGKDQSYEFEEWYFGDIRRVEAENLLLENMKPGTFIVRNAESSAINYSLSVCDGTENIKHYRIKRMDNGNYYISTRINFSSLKDLVNYYKRESDGLCCCLVSNPPKIQPQTYGLSKNTWEEPRNNFRLTKKLGAGQFGEVWEALYKNSTLVAVKTLKPGSMSAEEFLAEANIMKKAQHENLVQLLAVCTDGQPLYIVTEYMRNGSLLDYLKNNRDKIKPRNMVDMAIQISKGMAFLESRKFIHRDLAARNILVSHDLKYKVADFGLARMTKEDEYEANEKSKFPIKWTAPEAAMYHKFSTKSDVWSYGILLYEIITYGAQPYLGMSNMETIKRVADGFRMPCPTGCNPEIYKIMLKCWNSEPELRPSFGYIRNFFEEFYMINQSRYTDM